MWNYIFQELSFSAFHVSNLFQKKHVFFRGLLPVCCFHFHDSSFPLATFSPLHFSLLLLVVSYIALSCRYYCGQEGLRNCMENENVLILCSGHASPIEILFDINLSRSTHDVFLFLCPR